MNKNIKKEILLRNNTGSQPKFKENGYWYKIDSTGCEGLCEELSSIILECSLLPQNIEFVKYKSCNIDSKKGCVSLDFLKENEKLITFDRLYRNYTGFDFSNDVFVIPNIKERYDYIISFMKDYIHLDISDYLKTIITLDAFILNPDRHYSNLALIYNKKEEIFKYAPIFDNGQGLCSNFSITPPYLSIEKKIDRLFGRTISGSFEMAMMEVGIGMRINFEKLEEKIEGYSKSIPLETLRYQIERYRDLLKINDKVNEIDSRQLFLLKRKGLFQTFPT